MQHMHVMHFFSTCLDISSHNLRQHYLKFSNCIYFVQNFYQLFDIITTIFPVTWQCLRCCVETRDLRYVIIFRSKKVNTDGVVSLNVLTARRLQDNKLKLKTVQSTGKCWQWLSHREYCIIYTLNDPIFRLVSFLFAVFVLFWSRHVDHLCIALKWR